MDLRKDNKKRLCGSRKRVKRTRPAGPRPAEREKEKELEEREIMTAKDDWGSKGARWDTKSEESDDQDESTRQNVRKMVMASMKKEEEEREERVRVAPNMRAGGSYAQATTDLEEKGAQGNVSCKADCIGRGVGMAKGGEFAGQRRRRKRETGSSRGRVA